MYRIKETIIQEEIDGGFMLLDPITEKMAVLKQRERMILEYVQIETVTDLAKRLSDICDEDVKTIESDIHEFCQTLEEAGFIETV